MATNKVVTGLLMIFWPGNLDINPLNGSENSAVRVVDCFEG